MLLPIGQVIAISRRNRTKNGGFPLPIVVVTLLTVSSCVSSNHFKIPGAGAGPPIQSFRPFPSLSRSRSPGPQPGLPALLSIDESSVLGTLDLTAYSLGQGGLSTQPMLHPHVSQLLETHPKTMRIFLEKYYNIYPDHDVYNWAKLDRTLSDIVATGAHPIANIDFKPKVLFPTID
jgi:hypothetical protein